MKRKETQRSLKELWPKKKKTSQDAVVLGVSGEEFSDAGELESDEEQVCNELDSHSLEEMGEESNSVSDKERCINQCCAEEKNVYQPKGKEALSLFAKNDRKFLPLWYDKHEWLTLCTTKKKVFCVYCRYAHRHDLLTFSKKGEEAFTVNGFDNYKKASQKFRAHENSDLHLESKLKWNALTNPSIATQLSTQIARAQLSRRAGLLKQLEAMRYLLRQGIALRGHSEEEGNLPQLLAMWSSDNNDIKHWIKEGKYLSHDIINEMISLMGQNVLRQILAKIMKSLPSWYAVIADEATDVTFKEQFNLSIRYVDDDYIVHEDSVGLFDLPNTKAETLFVVLKDMLTRCALPLSLCRGQAYDGAATMQGKRKESKEKA